MTKKIWGLQIFCAGVEPPETDMFHSHDKRKKRGDSGLNSWIRAAGEEGSRV